MPIGRIHIQSLTGGVLPCAGVFVSITDAYGTVISELFTDENGDSQPIEVYAPPVELSLEEDNEQQPYATYDLYAWQQGFEALEVFGIQVFEGQTSLQQLNMQPTDWNNDPAPLPQEYDIPAHHLLDPTSPAPSVAPADDCTGSRVLGQVVVPQYITVHLGRPSASASNVTVTFKDYIKNVASSEIYPTWPEQSLRANIYCQISLALNRVYTEWYLSKGYPFQITNSTSYDQYYVHGRNIFENISKLVDEIFATYIRRPGTINPFYAEYCDGKSVTCPGLKQWGTVTLANQGYSAINILRYYYGSNIELVRTSTLSSIPQSYPGTPLRVGSSGAAVRTIQRQLNRIAQNYPSFGTLTVDGNYGAATAEVVRRFQRQFSLTADGVVGYATWYRISYVYVAVKRLAELSSEGEFPNQDSVSNASGGWGGTTLSIGSSGTAVKQVQYWLNTVRGYINGLPLLAVDGVYGSGTAAAVRIFQAWAGLTVDGIVGQATWNKLYREFSSVMLEENTDLIYVTQYPGSPLRQGSSGSAVRTLQFWLSIISNRYASVPSVTVDDIYGAATAASVRSFQRLFGLTVDGVVGSLTWNKLRQIFASVVLTLVPAGDFPGTYPGTPLRRGSTGSAVREMQYYLYVLSLYYPSLPTISYDGTFGTATYQAVIAFQTLFGLSPDGVVGPATWSALYAAYVRIITVEGAARTSDQQLFCAELRRNSEGSCVVWLQRMLDFISLFYDTVLSPVQPQEATVQEAPAEPGGYDPEGLYGPYTEAAVRSFQQEFSLPVTGQVDHATWDAVTAIFEACNGEDIYGEENSTDGSWPCAVLQLGSFGSLVTQLQSALNQLGQSHCDLRFVEEGGIFRQETLDAVYSAQRVAEIPVVGGVTFATWTAIQKALADGGSGCSGNCDDSGDDCCKDDDNGCCDNDDNCSGDDDICSCNDNGTDCCCDNGDNNCDGSDNGCNCNDCGCNSCDCSDNDNCCCGNDGDNCNGGGNDCSCNNCNCNNCNCNDNNCCDSDGDNCSGGGNDCSCNGNGNDCCCDNDGDNCGGGNDCNCNNCNCNGNNNCCCDNDDDHCCGGDNDCGCNDNDNGCCDNDDDHCCDGDNDCGCNDNDNGCCDNDDSNCNGSGNDCDCTCNDNCNCNDNNCCCDNDDGHCCGGDNDCGCNDNINGCCGNDDDPCNGGSDCNCGCNGNNCTCNDNCNDNDNGCCGNDDNCSGDDDCSCNDHNSDCHDNDSGDSDRSGGGNNWDCHGSSANSGRPNWHHRNGRPHRTYAGIPGSSARVSGNFGHSAAADPGWKGTAGQPPLGWQQQEGNTPAPAAPQPPRRPRFGN